MVKIGVYVCHCGFNIAGVINCQEVAEFAKTLPNVVIAKDYIYVCSEPGQKMIQEDIKNFGLDRIVIASCSPRMHEETFRKTISEVGLNPYMVEVVNLREQCSWCHSDEPEKATEKAKELVKMGVFRASLLEPLEKFKVKAEKSVLVLGGGIAGIQASLDLADLGFKVYLVEKTPSIGGRMAQLDKTFPTLDCSACILTPKMVDAARHPNIKIITNAEVESVDGFVGNYKVTILKKPRYVDEDKCTGCGECEKYCPVKVPSEFEAGLSMRKAIYQPFKQAVPRTYLIDSEHCLYFTKGVCRLCERFCKAKAINFEQKEELIKLEVGAILIAVGSEIFDATKIGEFGYGKFKNVISNLQFERLCNASGPTGGKILCPESGKVPKSIAFIQCVGSRDARFHEYCCRIGCMISLKQAILAKEKLGEEVEVYICFNDIRAFGKGYEEFYKKAREMGVRFIAGLPSEIHKNKDGSLYFDVYELSTNKLLRVNADLVVLATGLVPSPDFEKIRSIFNLSRSPDGFFMEAHPKLRPLETFTNGIFLAGTCQGPKDIPDTVAQASGAAMKIADLLAKGEIEIEPLIAKIDGELCSGCGICRDVCSYRAIELKPVIEDGEEKLKAEVIEAMCQGCGSCSSACPSHAIKMQHYTDQQILAQIRAALT